MRARRTALTALLLTSFLPLAGCGDEGTTPQDAVRDVVTRFGTASAKKDYQEICDQLISRSLSDNVEEYGLPCELAFKQGLDAVVRPKLVIRDLRVTGDVAKVRIHTTAANQPPSDDLLELRRADGKWQITALGAAPKGNARTPTTTTTPR